MNSPAEATAKRELIEAERSLYRAMIGRDRAALERILAADLVYIHSTAVAESRIEYLAGVANGLYEYGTIVSRDIRWLVRGDIAVMNGIVDMTVGSHGAAKQLIHLLFCLVWAKHDGAWRLHFRQATRIPQGPA